jgi:acyl-CoA reductase-like NAD-dependent aldehyde dehydrogenase
MTPCATYTRSVRNFIGGEWIAPMAFFPFGGSRGSFYGDLKAQRRDAIEFFTDKRVVISRW